MTGTKVNSVKAFWKRLAWAPYYYSVHIVTNGAYEGVGAFCDTWEDVLDFCKAQNVTEIVKRED